MYRFTGAYLKKYLLKSRKNLKRGLIMLNLKPQRVCYGVSWINVCCDEAVLTSSATEQ